eukprot:TRINITY_DN63593_c0_g1_i1.p1 TRINITY_DN63593_c0_g1~~TRINITY_DN63593_c0_g1_i1.p1  ORF type:complete len:460 (-),score=110.55 TRINITY_DN63593_c0_g1_i1:355-1734(-)
MSQQNSLRFMSWRVEKLKLLVLVTGSALVVAAGQEEGGLAEGGMTGMKFDVVERGLRRIDTSNMTDWANRNIEPLNAAAFAVVAKGSKRHKLLEEIAKDKQMQELMAFGAWFDAAAESYLAVRRFDDDQKDQDRYDGKWTKTAIMKWLKSVAYPLINVYRAQFSPMKYLTANPFGSVLILKRNMQYDSELRKTLEAYAKKYRNKLKFTFWYYHEQTRDLCRSLGIWSDDEILILEKPSEMIVERSHRNVPSPPKFRMKGLTDATLTDFFTKYEKGLLPVYYKSAIPKPAAEVKNHVRILTGWDFLEVVNNATKSVVVLFTSHNCELCTDFSVTYEGIAKRVAEAQSLGRGLEGVVVAKIDQTENEHPEMVKGTPWLRYWPRGKRKKSLDVDSRSPDGIFDYLERNSAHEIEEMEEEEESSKKRKAKKAKKKDKAAKEEAPQVQLSKPPASGERKSYAEL